MSAFQRQSRHFLSFAAAATRLLKLGTGKDKFAPYREAGIGRVLFEVPDLGGDEILRVLDKNPRAPEEMRDLNGRNGGFWHKADNSRSAPGCLLSGAKQIFRRRLADVCF